MLVSGTTHGSLGNANFTPVNMPLRYGTAALRNETSASQPQQLTWSMTYAWWAFFNVDNDSCVFPFNAVPASSPSPNTNTHLAKIVITSIHDCKSTSASKTAQELIKTVCEG